MTIDPYEGVTPSRSLSRSAFVAAWNSFLAWLVGLPVQMNALLVQMTDLFATMTAVASAGAFSIVYQFSTTTADADPGPGKLRLGSGTQNTATVIRADLLDALGADWSTALGLVDDSTSTVKGFIRLVNASGEFLLFTVSALATPSGYVNITVACQASSSANPFSDGEEIELEFSRTGDKGDQGNTGTGITAQAVGFDLAGGTSSKTLQVRADMTLSGFASQAEAEAGSDNTKEMTPLRVAQEITARNPAKWTAIGSPITTTSGTAQRFSSITRYEDYMLAYDGVSPGAGTPKLRLEHEQTSAPGTWLQATGFGEACGAASALNGAIIILGGGLTNAIALQSSSSNSGASWAATEVIGLRHASAMTGLGISWDGGQSFDAGTLTLYGRNPL